MNINLHRYRGIAIGLVGVSALCVPALAFASGPGGGQGNGSGDNGRGQQEIVCDGTTYVVAVPNAMNANGAGQVVDANGHGIPAMGTFTITDMTTGMVLDSETFGNNGHRNQELTQCTGDAFSGTASDFFGSDLPPGVAPDDTITGSLEVFVVLKV